MITLTLPYPPSANVYWRYVNGKVLVSTEARRYKETVGGLFLVAKVEQEFAMIETDDVLVLVQVYRPRKSGDLDNTLKITLDSLRGLAYRDDSQIVCINALRYDDKDNPRIEVQVMTMYEYNDVELML